MKHICVIDLYVLAKVRYGDVRTMRDSTTAGVFIPSLCAANPLTFLESVEEGRWRGNYQEVGEHV